MAGPRSQIPVSALSRIAGLLIGQIRFTGDFLAGAIAGVDREAPGEPLQRRLVPMPVVTLPVGRLPRAELVRPALIGLESQPFQVFQDRRLVLGATAAAVMIFQTEEDPPPAGPRDTPDVNRVGNVSQVQVTGWAGSEAGEGTGE